MTWLSPTERTITSYAQADALWSRVRSPAKGKPVTGWLRMYKRKNGDFLFQITGYGAQNLCVLTPDNKLTFVLPNDAWCAQAQTLVSALHRWLPFTTMRHRTGLYRIAGSERILKLMQDQAGEVVEGQYYFAYRHYTPVMRQQAYYFEGIEFDLISGECLNPQPDVRLIEKPEERKQWRRALAAFKKGIKARVRVHAFDGIIDQMWAEREAQNRWDWRQPSWKSKQWMDILENSIRNNEFPPELLTGLAQTTSNGYYMANKPTGQDVLKALDFVCNQQSIELRQRFGVFEQED